MSPSWTGVTWYHVFISALLLLWRGTRKSSAEDRGPHQSSCPLCDYISPPISTHRTAFFLHSVSTILYLHFTLSLCVGVLWEGPAPGVRLSCTIRVANGWSLSQFRSRGGGRGMIARAKRNFAFKLFVHAEEDEMRWDEIERTKRGQKELEQLEKASVWSSFWCWMTEGPPRSRHDGCPRRQFHAFTRASIKRTTDRRVEAHLARTLYSRISLANFLRFPSHLSSTDSVRPSVQPALD